MRSEGRIVVTGMGVVSPLGVGIEPMWTRLTAGQSGLRRIPEAVVPDIEAKVGGLVPAREEEPHGFDLAAAVEVRDRKKMDRFIQFALEAARQATLQAGWNPQEEGPSLRTATSSPPASAGCTASSRPSGRWMRRAAGGFRPSPCPPSW
jgi:3-oxoacyl-[acyl-carrier-protein] synthase II